MGLGSRSARHETIAAQKNAVVSSEYWEFQPKSRVMTVDGIPGTVASVADGPYPGTEEYQVTLDNGLGGGAYTASQLRPISVTTASHEHEAAGAHLASEDYPELGTILHDRPPIERIQYTAARGGGNPFDVRHVETDTGGTKFPRRVDTTAHHPETGEQVGSARYFPPKRKGGPISIDEVNGHAPGAASAMLDDIESRHPGSKTVFLHQVKRNNNDPAKTGNDHEYVGAPSDWDAHYPNLTPVVHRGLSLKLDSWPARTVNSSSSTKDEHLAEIHKALGTSSAGTHWTENESAARLFAHNAVSDHRTEIPVVLHARTPERKDIETRHDHLRRGGVFPYGHPHSSEDEVPIRKGRGVKVTGISWRPDAAHPDADEHGWVHHTYDEPMHHTAAAEPATGEPMVQEVPSACSSCGSDDLSVSGDNGRNVQATCNVCNATMSSWGGQFTPELIGDPSNRPDSAPDPAGGSLGFTPPMRMMDTTDHIATFSTWHLASDDDDYRMQHQPMDAEDGSPLHDVTMRGHYPADVYTHTHYYADYHSDGMHEAVDTLHKARGKPNKKVRIYRAMPADHVHKGIQQGNWVTTSKEYARQHGRHHEDSKKDWPVISAVVEAQHLNTDGNDLREYGYHGPDVTRHGVAFAGGAEEKVSARADGTVSKVQRRPKPEETHPGFTFSHYSSPSDTEGKRNHMVVAYDPQENWAGRREHDDDGNVRMSEVEPEHENSGLHERMAQEIDTKLKRLKKSSSLSAIASFLDDEGLFHFTAAWSDVREKARRLRSEGAVRISVASGDGIGGEVKGDNNVYETMLSYIPGSQKVAYWTCGCKWAAYAWGRSPAYKRFEGRMCSHALAMQFEAQARGMFGKTVEPDAQRPSWMRQRTPVVVRHQRDTGEDLTRRAVPPGNMRRTFEGSLNAEPDEFAPIFTAVAFALAEDGPEEVLRSLAAIGYTRQDAQFIVREAAHICPDCGNTVAVNAVRCPRCGAELGEPDPAEMHLASRSTASEEDTEGPTHAGVVLKARDTGRILMLQRGLGDEEDPHAGKWEFPGGGIEPRDHTSLHAAMREFEEEVGQKFPKGGALHHVWEAPGGKYHGHVVVIPHESMVGLHNGRVTVNPDDPDGETPEQAAWWEVEHARKNPALREECKKSPWKEIAAAGGAPKTAAAWDPLTEFPSIPGDSAPPHSNSENPGSTGFATSMDPPEFDIPDRDVRNMELSPGWLASLHEQPEPALPTTDGGEHDDEQEHFLPTSGAEQYRETHSDIGSAGLSASPNQFTGSVADIVARFQATAGAAVLNSGKGRSTSAGPSDGDIASAARAHLEKLSLKQFTFQEQQELITEGALDNVMARNVDKLDIVGTHYLALEEALAVQDATGDPDELFI